MSHKTTSHTTNSSGRSAKSGVLAPYRDAVLDRRVVVVKTRDMYADPPLEITVRLNADRSRATNPASTLRWDPAASHHGITTMHLSEADLEQSAGLVQLRDGSASQQITICLMHSFGKCKGKGGGAHTCNQLHVRPEVMASLRQEYDPSTRRLYLARSVRAVVGKPLQDAITRLRENAADCRTTPKSGAVASHRAEPMRAKFLEFLINDVEDTRGKRNYECKFREWLAADPKKVSDLFESPVQLCPEFTLEAKCSAGDRCPMIHADPIKAKTRDGQLKDFLHTTRVAASQREQANAQASRSAPTTVPATPAPEERARPPSSAPSTDAAPIATAQPAPEALLPPPPPQRTSPKSGGVPATPVATAVATADPLPSTEDSVSWDDWLASFSEPSGTATTTMATTTTAATGTTAPGSLSGSLISSFEVPLRRKSPEPSPPANSLMLINSSLDVALGSFRELSQKRQSSSASSSRFSRSTGSSNSL